MRKFKLFVRYLVKVRLIIKRNGLIEGLRQLSIGIRYIMSIKYKKIDRYY